MDIVGRKAEIRSSEVEVTDVLRQPALVNQLKRHSLLYFAGRGASGMINFLSISIFARLLAADGYGLFTLVVNGVLLANAILMQWLRIAIVRYLPIYRENRHDLISVTLAIYVLEALVSTIVFIPIICFFYNEKLIIIIMLLILLAQGWFDLSLDLARAGLKPVQYGALLIGKSLLSLLFSVVFIWLGWGVYGALIGQLAGLLIPGGLAYRLQWRGAKLVFQYKLAQQFVAYGFPISIAIFFSSLIIYMDRFLIAWFTNQRSVGLYTAIYDMLSALLLFITQIPTLAGFPLAVHAYQKGDTFGCQQILRETYLISLRYSLPLVGILIGFSHPFVSLMLGSDFVQAHYLLWWLCPALIVYGLVEHYYNRSFWITGASWRLMGVMGTAAWVNGVLNILFIPRYGLVGAAGATLVAYVMAAIISLTLSRRTFPLLSLTPDLSRLLIAFGAMWLVLIVTSPWRGIVPITARAVLGIGVYWISLMILSKRHREKQESTSSEVV